jgi:hypothetical protein
MSDGRPSQAVEEKSTASDGTFALEGDPGSYLVVGLQDQSLPLVRQVALAPSSDLQLEPAEFSSGSRIGGHITILGLPAPPDCEVHAQRQVEGPAIRLLNQDLIWFEGDLHVRSRASRTDDQGRFSLETLEPGLHRVSVEKLPEQRMLRATLDVLAPAADVAIDIEAARLILHLRSEDQPIEGAHIALHENGYGGSVWGFGGKTDLDVLVPPGSAYVVDVDKDAYATAHFDLNMPSSGGTVEQVVELVRRTDSAELVIELVTSNGKQIQGAGFGLFGTKIEPHGRYRPARRSSHGRVPDIVRQVNAEGGVFHLRNLPPDRYTVEVVADGGWDGRSSDWYGDSIEVELGAQSVEQRRMEVRLGGHLRIQCVDRKGEVLPARCRLSEAGKVDVPLEFMTHDEKGSTWIGHGSLNTSAPNGANETFPGLPLGRYTLRASLDGYREWAQDVTIESGKVIDVSIVMQDA